MSWRAWDMEFSASEGPRRFGREATLIPTKRVAGMEDARELSSQVL